MPIPVQTAQNRPEPPSTQENATTKKLVNLMILNALPTIYKTRDEA
jgi:hypothetical protein